MMDQKFAADVNSGSEQELYGTNNPAVSLVVDGSTSDDESVPSSIMRSEVYQSCAFLVRNGVK